jgi:hypothetical protein
MRLNATLAVAALGTSVLVSSADAASRRWQCSIAPDSTYTQTTAIQLPLAGTWIGDYDATTNPTGTTTVPGYFGGSGNNAIPFSMVVKPTVGIQNAHPSGDMEVAFDPATGAFSISGFAIDVLDGQSGAVTTNIALTYSTFRTTNPSSLFPGVTNVNVPLNNGSLTTATAVQTAPAFGVATANADATWSFAAIVPVNILVEGNAFGAPFGGMPTPGVMALAGTLAFVDGALVVTTQVSQQDTQPLPALPALVNQPFDLPTVLPAGGVAHLLINGTFAAGTETTTVSANLRAPGVPVPVLGDLNGDGIVNGLDLGLMLSAWGSNGGPADLNNDGIVNGLDLGIQLANWTG